MPGQKGSPWGYLLGVSSAFIAVCTMGSFSEVEKFKVENDERRVDVCVL